MYNAPESFRSIPILTIENVHMDLRHCKPIIIILTGMVLYLYSLL